MDRSFWFDFYMGLFVLGLNKYWFGLLSLDQRIEHNLMFLLFNAFAIVIMFGSYFLDNLNRNDKKEVRSVKE